MAIGPLGPDHCRVEEVAEESGRGGLWLWGGETGGECAQGHCAQLRPGCSQSQGDSPIFRTSVIASLIFHQVVACDMANVPLESNSVDVAVFCLALMGINTRYYKQRMTSISVSHAAPGTSSLKEPEF